MEQFDYIFILIANEKGIGLNLDILETGLINYIGLLFITKIGFDNIVGDEMDKRETKLIENIQNAENNLQNANIRLNEVKKLLNQGTIVINNIKIETLKTKKQQLKLEMSDAQLELGLRFERAINAYKLKERQIFIEIKEQITSLVLNRTVNYLQEKFIQNESSAKLINNTIRKLELPL